ncbi:MAG TPA: M23 family metallopeptidase [Acidimicrobiales bacterium]|nr:M23 family metallopeptidase [Acidimicrobiales bacterium]
MPRGGGTRGARTPGRQGNGLRRRLVQAVAFVEVIVLAMFATSALLPAPAWADAGSDQAQIAQLGSRIVQDGALVQRLVTTYDLAQAHEAGVTAQLDAVGAHLGVDRRAEAKATAVLRKIAVNSYMNGIGDPNLVLFASGNATALEAGQEYASVVSVSLESAVDAVKLDAQRTQSVEAQLRSDQSQAEASVQQLAGADQAAQAALSRDNALLSQVQGNLQALLAATARQREAAEEAEEEQMATQTAQAAKAASGTSDSAPSHPVTVTLDPSPGSYANPLRAVDALTPERIDQGVDYSGYGPIYAIGDGVVLSTVNSGWPGGTFISYRLTDGPARGLVVYAAEDIDPVAAVGQSVTAGTVLGTVYEGPNGIETGWADPSGDGVTMAMDAGQFSGANSTAFGANFSQLLTMLGAPPGVAQNEPPTGSLPPGWPTW